MPTCPAKRLIQIAGRKALTCIRTPLHSPTSEHLEDISVFDVEVDMP